jgi:MFS family permease
VLSTFAPYLLTEFRWSKSNWPTMGSISALVILFIPIAGRLADRFGVRAAASVCIIMFPLITLACCLIGSPLISAFVAGDGWRDGFMVVAAIYAVCGIITLLLLSAPERKDSIRVESSPSFKTSVFRSLAKRPLLWMLLLASFMVSRRHAIFTNQIKLVVLKQGANDATAAISLSIFAAVRSLAN